MEHVGAGICAFTLFVDAACLCKSSMWAAMWAALLRICSEKLQSGEIATGKLSMHSTWHKVQRDLDWLDPGEEGGGRGQAGSG